MADIFRDFVLKWGPPLAELVDAESLFREVLRPAEAQKLAEGMLRSGRTPLPAEYSPALMLQAARSPVEFRFRDQELSDFEAWALSAPNGMPGWRLLTGGPGRGKTRLMMQFAERLNADPSRPWTAGFLDLGDLKRHPEKLLCFHQARGDLLFVIDYAERFEDEVVLTLFTTLALAQEFPDRRIRLVLISRRRSDLWAEIPKRHEDIQSYFDIGGLKVVDLAKIADRDVSREDVYRAAAKDFSDILAVEPPAVCPDLTAKEFSEVLMIHIAALAGIMGEAESKGASPEALLQWVADREERHWDKTIDEKGLPPALKGAAIRQAAAYLTLIILGDKGIATRDDAISTLRNCPLLDGQTEAELGKIADFFHEMYPGAGWVNGVTPDRLGTYYLAMTDDSFIGDIYGRFDG